jgi:hypothetical protein
VAGACGGVHEDYALAAAGRLCQLGAQLVQRQDLGIVGWEDFLQGCGDAPGYSVVAAQRVSIGDNQEWGSHDKYM